MGKHLAARWAAAAASAAFVFAAAPALAHDEAADGFTGVLHGPHHHKLATDEGWPSCETVRQDAGELAGELIRDGFDVWVFNASPADFDSSAGVTTLQASFRDLSGAVVTVTVPGPYASWIGPEANPHLAAVSVPAGWTLLDADFAIDEVIRQGIRVTHTCPGEPGEGPEHPEEPESPSESGSPQNPGESADPGHPPGGGDDEAAGPLPVTGSAAGRLVIVGGGLLAAGAASVAGAVVLAARRQRRIARLAADPTQPLG